ncbi:hypothetical protein P8A22_00945 [Streptomyces laculatispora]|uniref:YrdC-like domain-containing protein n=1 Tax=Streptomyces laculatispora TaxID=887464 RepID=A0ABY9HXP5_9ACTN|nr:hypothetical protein [Streptomyces laculatispora]WLQ38742.1 hypothetical protein P8A22_00945 [Streptomyces laculatispora]
MTAPDGGSIAAVRAALSRGQAVVLPNPAPLTYVVAATAPHAVNRAKSRPADQPVALWSHHAHTTGLVLQALDLAPHPAEVARRLLTDEQVTLLAPLRLDHSPPPWLKPATHEGWTLLFGARWSPLLSVLNEHPVLYVSSANRTGRLPAATAADAYAMFPGRVPVLDPDMLPGTLPDTLGSPPRAATTTIRLHPDGRMELHRSGAQDQAYSPPTAYLDHLRASHWPGPTA